MCLSAFFLTFTELLHHYSMSPLLSCADSHYKIVFNVNYLLPLVVYMRESKQETMFTIASKLNIITTSCEVQHGLRTMCIPMDLTHCNTQIVFFKHKIPLHFFVGFQSILGRFLSSFVITQAVLAAPFH